MDITKKETTSVIITIDKLCNILSRNMMEDSEFIKILPIVAKICIKLHPLYDGFRFVCRAVRLQFIRRRAVRDGQNDVYAT
jgi:hypothetical protein